MRDPLASEPDPAAGIRNLVTGTELGNVVQAGHIEVVNLASLVPVAMAGLPATVDFAGRSANLAELAALLDPAASDSEPTIASITGLAGIGKTALAVRAAHEAVAAGWFPGGVLFVDLHGYDPDGSVTDSAALAAVLDALGVTGAGMPAGAGEREVRYRSEMAALATKGKRVLIVVDNVSDVAQVRALRPADAVHRMLITSRDNLPVPGARRVELDVLPDAEAIAVLAQALRKALPGDTRISDQSADAVRLVRLCDCLPLALWIIAELLADRPSMAIGRLVRTVTTATDRLAELSYGESLAVRAAFDTSYRRLPVAVARLFRLLSLNPGPFTGLGAVAALADAREDAAARLAEALRRTHLIQPANTGDGYRFHDLVRRYARHHAETEETSADRNAAIGRLVAYYRTMTQAANTHLEARTPPVRRSASFPGRNAALTWLENERSNLIPVINLAARTGRDEHTRDIVVALAQFFYLRKHVDEWITVTKFGLDAAQRLGDREAVGRALTYLGAAYQDLRWYGEAGDYHERSLAVCQVAGDQSGQCRAWSNLGSVSYQLGRSEQALAHWREALPLAQQLGDRYLEGTILNNLGFAFTDLCRYDQAEDHYRQALDCMCEMGDRQTEGGVRTNLGVLYQRTHRYADAIDAHQQALPALRESGDRLREARALHNLALVYQDLGRWAEALDCHQIALPIRQEVADRHGEGETLTNLGLTYVSLDRPDEARVCQGRALAAFIQTSAENEAELARQRLADLNG